MSQAVIDGIYTLLTTDQTAGSFYDDLTGRIYHATAPQDALLPLAIFAMIDDEPFRYFTENHIDLTFTVDLYTTTAAGPDALMGINDKLFTVLDKQTVTISGFTGGQAYCISRGATTIDEDAILITSRWRVWASV